MINFDEGYIKFNCHWNETKAVVPDKLFAEINEARSVMVAKNLIGCYDNGIGFGNISVRDPAHSDSFFITGSATGAIKDSTPDIYALVERWDVSSNTLWCSGPVKASSESLSHAVIYETLPEVNCVIHIHSLELWKRWLPVVPCTPESVAYGTPEMASSIVELISDPHRAKQGVFAMKGHEEGIIAFGGTTGEATEKIFKLYLHDNQ